MGRSLGEEVRGIGTRRAVGIHRHIVLGFGSGHMVVVDHVGNLRGRVVRSLVLVAAGRSRSLRVDRVTGTVIVHVVGRKKVEVVRIEGQEVERRTRLLAETDRVAVGGIGCCRGRS